MENIKSVLNVEVSKFDGYNKPFLPETINLLNWLFDDSHKEIVERLRNFSFAEALELRRLKATLPGITVSGVFEQRLNEGLIKHSGLICIDIDAKENKDNAVFQDLKSKLRTAPFIAYCGKSVSGTGYYAIIPIKYPDKHKEHFKALQKLFAEVGVIIDAACKDVSRLRGYSWDAEPYINHNAVTFNCVIEDVPKPVMNRYTNYRPGGDDTTSLVERYINEITGGGIDIASQYEDWRDVGFALVSEFGEGGRHYFHDVSRWSSKYDYADADSQYTYCLRSSGKGITIGTFFHLCKEAGIKLKGRGK